MKKIIFACLMCITVSAGLTAYAANGDIAGQIYSTDIIAYIGGNEVPSYNIGGRTAVIIEDLDKSEYGYPFWFVYDDEKRMLTADGKTPYKTESKAERGKPGEILGNIYETDITVNLNNHDIKGYNIGGKTAVCIEDIGDMADSPNEEYGYSKFAAKYVWNEKDRTISLDFAGLPQTVPGFKMMSQYVFTMNGNVLTAEYDDMNLFYSEFVDTYNEDMPKYVIRPLRLKLGDDEEVIGFYFVDRDGSKEMNVSDYDGLFEKLMDYKKAHKQKLSYDEIMQKFNDGKAYEIKYSIDTDDYTFILTKNLQKEDCIDYVSVKKSGDFVILYNDVHDYTETTLEKKDKNTVSVAVSPFAGPHGATTMTSEYNLDDYDIYKKISWD